MAWKRSGVRPPYTPPLQQADTPDELRKAENMIYFQCELSQGTRRTRGYIEQRGAAVGRLVEIKDDGFDGLWCVDQVADRGVEERALREKQMRDRDPFGSIAKRH